MTDLKQARALPALGSNHMRQIADAWLEHQRRRFTRPDARRWWRCDAGRYRRFDPRFQRGRGPFDGKANFNPNQPRAPAGSEGAGRWTDGGRLTLVADKPSSPRRLGRWGAAVEVLRLAIETFGKDNLLRNLFGETVPVVAITSLDDQHVFGLNSDISHFSDLYTDKDRALADQFRDNMLVKYPDTMNLENIGWKPNDALYHAEATVLLRAWEQNGGTLEGKELLVVVNKEMCDSSCPKVLPKLGLELGDPRITFVDDKGKIKTMKSGKWERFDE